MYHYVHMQKTQETSFRSPSKNLAGNVIRTYLNNLKKSWCVRLSFILYQAPKHWTSTASVGRPWSRWSEVVPCKNNTNDVAHRSMLKRTSVAPLCANLLNIQPWGSRWFCPHDIFFFFSGYAVACNHHEVHTICTTWFHKKNNNCSLWDLLSLSLCLATDVNSALIFCAWNLHFQFCLALSTLSCYERLHNTGLQLGIGIQACDLNNVLDTKMGEKTSAFSAAFFQVSV